MPNATPQLCIDPITGVEVLYAPLRAQRANALAREPLVMPVNEFCPFCPGHEQETPPSVFRWPEAPETPWQLRVVPNRFPAVATHDEHLLPEEAATAFGRHEVLIESARHEDDWLSISTDQLARILQAVTLRIREWSLDRRTQQIQVFKNVGSRAGATLAHPHLQLVCTNYLPLRMVDEMMSRQSPASHSVAQKVEDELIVERSAGYMTYCPPVSRVPYELCVLPVENKPFSNLSFDELVTLARHLQGTLKRLEAAIGKVAHNVIWRLPPLHQGHQPWRIDDIPWCIEIVPRLTTFAGLELGSGLYVNPVRPETAAQQLSALPSA